MITKLRSCIYTDGSIKTSLGNLYSQKLQLAFANKNDFYPDYLE